MKNEQIESSVRFQLHYIGEDPEREGLQKTPYRIVKMWDEIFAGYEMDSADLLTTFAADGYDEIVLLKDIELYSMCEHHMLPFFGKAHVAYIPDKKVIGISKLARLVDIYAKRLQIQERLGDQVTDALMKHLKPKGAACIIEATHMCMRMRGVQKQNSVMTTSSMKGAFYKEQATRGELLQLIEG
jgi:GTP cyclohydrolase I